MARKNKIKLPKKVLGVKLPKSLRKGGKSIGGLFASPLGRAVLADVLVAAAGAAAATLVRHRPSAGQVADAGAAVADAGIGAATTAKDVARAALGAVGGAVADAARQALSPTGERRGDAPRQPGLAADRAAGKMRPEDKPREH